MGRTFYGMARALLAACGLVAFAAGAAPMVKTEHVEAELVSAQASAQPGKPATVGLKLRMEPEWHTYWKNPGDSGLATKIQWKLPPGWTAGEIQWPYPQKLPVGPLMNYGYEDEVVLLATLTPPADAKPGDAPLHAHVEWLVCKDICIPEQGELDFTLPVKSSAPAPQPRWQAHIERALNMLPVAAVNWKAQATLGPRELVVRLAPPPGAALPANVWFFPEREQLIEPAAPQAVATEGGALRIAMKLADPPVKVDSVRAVVVADSGWPGLGGRKAIEVEVPVTMAAAGAGTTSSATPTSSPGTPSASARGSAVAGSIAAALLFAFIGGILLNLMPCVFPVLGIKVMGFVEHAHGEARAMRLQGIVYTVGVLASFLVLAALMLALRAGGMQLGWGFQLQSPAFVTLLAALFFVLALNLSGVFEWGAFAQSLTANLSARGRYADAFLAGVLATVVATPCTAPFMGAAVGFTLSQDAVTAMGVFLALGAGMAIPVLALSLFPALLRRLPRPGAWMETFKQVLAFPLYATVAWLAWVLGAQASNDAVFALLAGLVLIGMAAWFYGRWAHAGSRWQPAVAVLLAGVGLAVAWPAPPAAEGHDGSHEAGGVAWQPWSPEKVAELTAQGVPVFVDFTAAWCVTCQVNKRVALSDHAVTQAIAAHGIVTLRADWTKQDPRITRTLAELGRNAVPVYALYVPGEPAPRLLPEVLTASLVLGELSQLPPTRATAVTQR
jgi:thiol:disulfide interchange protein/DsbC/DsbD-like thiol-disulfide interchange protein